MSARTRSGGRSPRTGARGDGRSPRTGARGTRRGDIGAVLVIALFYTQAVHWPALAVGAGFLLSLIAANWAGVRHPLVYGLLGLAVAGRRL